MTWLAWRQFRTQAIIALGVAAVLAVFVLFTGPHLHHLFETVVRHCAKHNDCNPVTSNFRRLGHWGNALSILVILVPALIGVFWGAPLIARELEGGTFRVAWTQSVTRMRWATTKLAVVGLASVVTAGLFSLLVTWWQSPYDSLSRSPYSTFDSRDVVPLAYAAFAFALGVALGCVIRRAVPAMASTLAVFIGVRIAVQQYLRPHFLSPIHIVTNFVAPGPSTGPVSDGSGNGWSISSVLKNAAGKVIGQNGGIGPNGNIDFRGLGNGVVKFVGVGTCPNKFPSELRSGGGKTAQGPPPGVQRAVEKCVDSFHLKNVLTYQPGSRYWTFQWIEFSLYLTLALALIGFSVWWIRKRIS
ncbi:MAG TPA: ABC transporter permease subunit [Acidimicrobiales bacterium]